MTAIFMVAGSVARPFLPYWSDRPHFKPEAEGPVINRLPLAASLNAGPSVK
jgi:hypothetical protein